MGKKKAKAKKKRAMKKKARSGKEVKVWMIRKGITQADIVRATGLNKGLVCRTVNGDRNCGKVLEFLEERGISKGLLWRKKG